MFLPSSEQPSELNQKGVNVPVFLVGPRGSRKCCQAHQSQQIIQVNILDQLEKTNPVFGYNILLLGIHSVQIKCVKQKGDAHP